MCVTACLRRSERAALGIFIVPLSVFSSCLGEGPCDFLMYVSGQTASFHAETLWSPSVHPYMCVSVSALTSSLGIRTEVLIPAQQCFTR